MPIKANDFVEIEYTGRLKDSGIVFDTTDEKVAKEHELPKAQYGPVVIIIGQGQLLKGLEEQIAGKEPGTYKIELAAEKAFGKKNAKLIQMVPASKFVQQKIQPVPGLRLNIDGMLCTIIQVTGGRVMVDFNHPLAGRDVVYELKVNKVVTDKKEQLKAVFAMLLNLAPEKMEIEGSKAKVEIKQELPKEIVPELQKKIKELTGIDSEIVSSAKPADKKPEERKSSEKKQGQRAKQ
ncbi:MAG: peptidylprolyl isomerase [Candidatus Woesearchaeota archaeon]